MPLRITCPGCSSALAIPDSMAGQAVRCTKCQKVLRVGVPAPGASVPTAPVVAPPQSPLDAILVDDDIPVASVVDEPDLTRSVQRGSAPRPSARVPEPASSRRQDEGRREPRSLRREPHPGGSNLPLILGLAGGGAVLLLMLVVGLAFWIGSSRAPQPQPPVAVAKKVEVFMKDRDGFRPGDKDVVPDFPHFEKKIEWKFEEKKVEEKKGDGAIPFERKDPIPFQPPVVERINLPPANTTSLGIRPAAWDGETKTLQLPGTLSDVKVGGGGRFLLFNLPQQRQIAIFDANEAKIVKYLPLADDTAVMTAGRDKLVVAYPDKSILQRWSLVTFEKEANVPAPMQGIGQIAMGHASAGPVLMVGKGAGPFGQGGVAWIDLQTLKPMNVPMADQAPNQMRGFPADAVFLQVSADGRTFGMRNGVGGEPHTVSVATLRETGVSIRNSWGFDGSVLAPSPDGRFFFTSGGVYNADLRKLAPGITKCIPATHGNYFLHIENRGFDERKGKVNICLNGTTRPLATVENVEGAFGEQIAYGTNRDKLTPPQRVHFMAGAKLLVSVPESNDRLIVRKLDLDAELEKSGADFLFVVSEPVSIAVKGKEYRYPIEVKSKKGGVKTNLDSGPAGMKVVGRELVWPVSADAAEREANVIVTVSDASGQEVFHTFAVSLVEKEGAK